MQSNSRLQRTLFVLNNVTYCVEGKAAERSPTTGLGPRDWNLVILTTINFGFDGKWIWGRVAWVGPLVVHICVCFSVW